MVRQTPAAISFDLGQTLVELDASLLREQVQRCGYQIRENQVEAELGPAWQAYNLAKSQKATGFDAWGAFMSKLLVGVELTALDSQVLATREEREAVVKYLWSEQPTRNLWQKPIAGIPQLLADLAEAGVALGVLTNSEGRAKELVEAVGLGPFIRVVVDSGLEGIEKPDAKIFQTLAERLGYPCEQVVHVGDSYEADVLGAIAANMSPIWFTGEASVTLPPGVLLCRTVSDLRRALLPSVTA